MSVAKVSPWIIQAKGYKVSRSVTRRTIGNVLRSLDCPRSLAVHLLYESGEHDQIVNLDIQEANYSSPEEFRRAYDATMLLRKADFLDLSTDPEAVALKKFWAMEALCADTNRRFRCLGSDPTYTGKNVWLLHAVTQKIQNILGKTNPKDGIWKSSFCPEELIQSCSWGPGATTLTTGNDTSAVSKFQSDTGTTVDLHHFIAPLFKHVSETWHAHIQDNFVLEKGNRVLFVPKDARTHRSIAKEPGINGFFQLGLGAMMRRRLLWVERIDLLDQTRNAKLAKRASVTGHLATVDLVSASGSISREFVREVFPSDWFTLMDLFRSKCGSVDGVEWFKWESFSSMGNGFTFPLQSIIFTAIAKSVCESLGLATDEVGVYGDDIIIPVKAYQTLVDFCGFCGFVVNTEKSFSTGFFRESCGAHYVNGLDAKPLYLREVLTDVESIYRLANAIRRLAHRYNGGFGCHSCFYRPWKFLLGQIPQSLRRFIPEGYGDGGLIGNFDEAQPFTRKARWGIEGYYVETLIRVGVKRSSEGVGLLLTRLQTASSKEYGNKYSLRIVTRRQVTRLLVPKWYDLGAWI